MSAIERLLSPRTFHLLGAILILAGLALPFPIIVWNTNHTPPILGTRSAEDLLGDLRPRMIVMPVTPPFALADTEVTRALYKKVMNKDPSESECAGDCPVENVSWFDAIDFCIALSKLEGLAPCYERIDKKVTELNPDRCTGYRLPTEKEWEVAAYAGTNMRWAGTDDESKLAEYAAFDKTHPEPVRGSRKPNGWFLYDMSGNVWEWVWDCWSDKANEADCDHVHRGGSFRFDPKWARVSDRVGGSPSSASGYYGFRVARSLLHLPPSAHVIGD